MQKARFLLAATLALAACGKAPEKTDGVDNASITDTAVNEEAAGSGAAGNGVETNAVTAPAPVNGEIPVALQGSWGLVAGDCGSDKSIAKGLLVIDAKQMRFYESVGKPAVVAYPTPSKMEGRFSFTGEGMEWSKDMTLAIEGEKLIRTEKDPVASYSYMRCKG